MNDNLILENSVPEKMFYACALCSFIGTGLMAATGRYVLMAVYLLVLACVGILNSLYRKGKISISTACLVPMLILCFLYTPLSWHTFNGLLGSTPYLSLLFIIVITLTYYGALQRIILGLYALLLLSLTTYWLMQRAQQVDWEQIINILSAYAVTAILSVVIIDGVKSKNLEINRQSTDLSIRDDLTGLLNRRAIEQVLAGQEDSYRKVGEAFAVAMLDVDQFKRINDQYGHSLGDAVLRSVASTLRGSVRDGDYTFRFGGDEFLVVLPRVDLQIVSHICKRFQDQLLAIHEYPFPLTVSVGYALRAESGSAEELVQMADQRMYEAKRVRREEGEKATGDPV